MVEECVTEKLVENEDHEQGGEKGGINGKKKRKKSIVMDRRNFKSIVPPSFSRFACKVEIASELIR